MTPIALHSFHPIKLSLERMTLLLISPTELNNKCFTLFATVFQLDTNMNLWS